MEDDFMEYEADKRSYRVLKLFETLQKLGQGAALATGIVWCLQDPDVRAIVTFDADGQHLAIDAVAAYDAVRDRLGVKIAVTP